MILYETIKRLNHVIYHEKGDSKAGPSGLDKRTMKTYEEEVGIVFLVFKLSNTYQVALAE